MAWKHKRSYVMNRARECILPFCNNRAKCLNLCWKHYDRLNRLIKKHNLKLTRDGNILPAVKRIKRGEFRVALDKQLMAMLMK